MTALVARARGLEARVLGDAALGEIERAPDVRSLAAALGRSGLGDDPSAHAIEQTTRHRTTADLEVLGRWSSEQADALAIIELDEDRHSLRAIVRGLAAGITPERRRLATVATSRLDERTLGALANATNIAELAALLADHPLAPALVPTRDGTIDVLEIEVALTKRFAEVALAHATDRALRGYVGQLIDGENATTALLLAARGKGLPAAHLFVPGGERLQAPTFAAAAKSSPDTARELIGRAMTGTPVARAIAGNSEAALDDALLAWQLATQHALRRSEPHGFAAVLHVLLRRRGESRRLRRAAWRVVLGGAR